MEKAVPHMERGLFCMEKRISDCGKARRKVIGPIFSYVFLILKIKSLPGRQELSLICKKVALSTFLQIRLIFFPVL